MARQDIIPKRAGACFKAEHFSDITEASPSVGFFEVHAENYMGAGGPPHAQLERIRGDFPLSIHGVGLSIGGAGDLDENHLNRLKTVVDRYQPALVSEHLAWSTHRAGYLNDLLALPYTQETLRTVAEHLEQVQSHLGRQVLLENPSTYVTFKESDIEETVFIQEVAERSGCGLLLDVNNVYVSSVNQEWDWFAYIDRFPLSHVQEIHLAGHTVSEDASGATLLIDTHNGVFVDAVAELYAYTIAKTGPVATLIEWDQDLPAWSELSAEAARAQAIMDDAVSSKEPRHVA